MSEPSPNKTQVTLVVLEILQDFDPERHTEPSWWDTLGLPRPERWAEDINRTGPDGQGDYARILVERSFIR